MLLDKTLSAEDYDNAPANGIAEIFARSIMREPQHKTKRRGRRASERLANEKAKLAGQELPFPKKTRTPQPTVCLWFSNVRQKQGMLTAKLGKLKVTLPDIPEVKTMVVAKDGTLIRLPLSLARQFGGRVW